MERRHFPYEIPQVNTSADETKHCRTRSCCERHKATHVVGRHFHQHCIAIRSTSVYRCLAGQLPGHHQCMPLAVQQGQRFETPECCSVSRHSRAVEGCASRIECTRKRVSNASACHWIQHAKASHSESTKTSDSMLLNTTCAKHCRNLSSDNSSVNSSLSKKFRKRLRPLKS